MKRFLSALLSLMLVACCFAGMAVAETAYNPDAIVYLTNTDARITSIRRSRPTTSPPSSPAACTAR